MKKCYSSYTSEEAILLDIYTSVRNNIKYKEDEAVKDEFKAPLLTMLEGYGDCEDYAMLICALGSVLTKKNFFIINTKDHAIAGFSNLENPNIKQITFCDATNPSINLGDLTINIEEIISIESYK